MGKYIIEGGKPLKGNVSISGAKNAAVAIIPAIILSDEPCIIENVPEIRDIKIIFNILKNLGASINKLEENTYEIDCTKINSTSCSHEYTSQMRASYYFIGALLSKYGEAHIAMPGGCKLGERPIDQHIKGFEALGAEVEIVDGIVSAKAEELKGKNIFLDIVSVGATMNIMLAAVKAKGITVIENAAKEPHVVDLANFLNQMGAKIKGAGTDKITITGVSKLKGVRYPVCPDQIEAGTYMVMAAITKGDITLNNVTTKHLEPITAKLKEMNIGIEETADSIRVFYKEPFSAVNIKTMPYPGFPTDMQPIITTLLGLARGESRVIESIFTDRFLYVNELLKTGAKLEINAKNDRAVITGVASYKGADLCATDLRAGAAMMCAALAAEGTSEISNIHYIERGYENVVEKITALGGSIKRTED